MIERIEHDGVVVLRLRHGKANALDLDLARAIEEAFAAEEGSPCRAVVVTGSGTIFSAGVDLHRLDEGGAAYAADLLTAVDSAFARMVFLPKPLVVAANGHAIAGGGVLLCTGDHRLVAEGDWKIGVPELRVGVPFPSLAFEIVRSAVAPEHLRDAVYGAGLYGPEEARTRGFVDEVVPAESLLERALEEARRLASIPAGTFRVTKRQLRSPLAARWKASLETLEERVREAWGSAEALDAVRRYVDENLR